MTRHPETPRRGPGTWVTVAAGAVAAAILVWGVLEMARARSDGRRQGTAVEEAADETPASFPPGTRLHTEVFSVSDAVLHRGTWFVLDGRGTQVHRIDESGDLLGSFGRGGEGPGELRRPVAIASHGDTVIVLDGADLHLFDLDGDHVADRRVALGGCPTGFARDLLSQQTGLLVLVDCRTPDRVGWAVILDAIDGPARTLSVRASDPGVVDLRMANAVLGAHRQGFVFGMAADECLDRFSPRGAELGEVCHDWIERLPVPEAVGDGMAGLRASARQRGLRLIEPDFLPPFVQVFSVGEALAYQVPLPGDLETFRLVMRGPSGEVAALPLPVAEGFFAAGNSVLLWWEDIEGMRFSVRILDAP